MTFTYWDRVNKNFPVSVAVPGQTGYSALVKNVGEIAKKGILKGHSNQTIVDLTELTIDRIEELRKEMKK